MNVSKSIAMLMFLWSACTVSFAQTTYAKRYYADKYGSGLVSRNQQMMTEAHTPKSDLFGMDMSFGYAYGENSGISFACDGIVKNVMFGIGLVANGGGCLGEHKYGKGELNDIPLVLSIYGGYYFRLHHNKDNSLHTSPIVGLCMDMYQYEDAYYGHAVTDHANCKAMIGASLLFKHKNFIINTKISNIECSVGFGYCMDFNFDD